MRVSRPCACGASIVANPYDPTPAIRAHQQTPEHIAYRAATETPTVAAPVRDLSAPALDASASPRLLGPCPCHDCGLPLWWTGFAWQETSGYRHQCEVAA